MPKNAAPTNAPIRMGSPLRAAIQPSPFLMHPLRDGRGEILNLIRLPTRSRRAMELVGCLLDFDVGGLSNGCPLARLGGEEHSKAARFIRPWRQSARQRHS